MIDFSVIDLELVRSIEIYRARVAETKEIKVYFMTFRNSVEEQIYLTSIQRENQAFETLIREKGSMVKFKFSRGL